MLLEGLAEFDSIEDAAKWAAGNYQKWNCFMWFGESTTPHSEHICLGYLVNNVDTTISQLTNADVVKDALAKWFDDEAENPIACSFASSVSGDRNVLGGIMIRVYESDGTTITPAFRCLYELVQDKWDDDHSCLDLDRRDAVNEREFIRWLTLELPSLCRDCGIQYREGLAQEVYDTLYEGDEEDFDCLDYDAVKNALQQR